MILQNCPRGRVGVNLSWSADFLLSNRDDVKVYLYDSTADMLMALCYQNLDAISADFFSSEMIYALTEGVNIVEPALYENEGLVDFMQTGKYDDWIARIQVLR